MEELGHAKSFRDLLIYKKSRAIAHEIFELTKEFPKEEMYSLTDQMRHSARSIGAQIAEAWAKRRYERHFISISKLTDADAEQLETQHWLDIAKDSGYLSSHQTEPIKNGLTEIGKMLNSMMNKANQFCGDHTLKFQNR